MCHLRPTPLAEPVPFVLVDRMLSLVRRSFFQLFTWVFVCLSTREQDLPGRLAGLQSLSELHISSLSCVGAVFILGVDVGPDPFPLKVCFLCYLCSSPLFLCYRPRSKIRIISVPRIFHSFLCIQVCVSQ